MLHVIGTRKSRAFRVLWILEELGVPYTHDPTSPRTPVVEAANPSGKIPVLMVDGTPIADSTSILTYLTDIHGAFTCPAGSLDRARQDALTFAILDDIDGALWTAAKHSFVLPEDQRVPEVKTTSKREFERALSRLETALQGPFLMGENMTIPDILLVHCLGWAKIAGFPEPATPMQDYMSRIVSRPAFQRAAKLP